MTIFDYTRIHAISNKEMLIPDYVYCQVKNRSRIFSTLREINDDRNVMPIKDAIFSVEHPSAKSR